MIQITSKTPRLQNSKQRKQIALIAVHTCPKSIFGHDASRADENLPHIDHKWAICAMAGIATSAHGRRKETTPQNTPQGLQDRVELSFLPSWPYEFTDQLVSRQDAAHFTINL